MKRIVPILLLILVLMTSTSFQAGKIAIPPEIDWSKNYGGTLSDQAYSMDKTSDGGYIIAGISESSDVDVPENHGMYDYYIVKVDYQGEFEWSKTFGGSGNDHPYSIIQTSDNGYIVAGYTESIEVDANFHGNKDAWIIKLDSNGNEIFSKCFGGSNYDVAHSIYQTKDEGYVVAISSYSNDGDFPTNYGGIDTWVVKLNDNGEVDWKQVYGGSLGEVPSSLIQTLEGGYILTGSSSSFDGDTSGQHGMSDIWILKLRSNGEIEWSKNLIGGTKNDVPTSIKQTNDSGYIISGWTDSNDGDFTENNGNSDGVLIKLNRKGMTQWIKCVGGSFYEYFNGVEQLSDGGFVIVGTSTSSDHDVPTNYGGYDYYILRANSSGKTIWTSVLGGTSSDQALCLKQTNDAGIIVAGLSNSINGDYLNNIGSYDFWIVKFLPENNRSNKVKE